ncbi:MAG: T9SS type A sorting domain-containing protein [Candidatus Sabulitectum sp.]|nr:T9SS type A sorting domain-containing protein [Candidatus Sabulitectum sp.]
MYRIFLLLILFSSFIASFADSVVQTDWSAGPGAFGPESVWENSFGSCQSCDWFSDPGSLKLGAVRVDTLFVVSEVPGTGPFCVVDFDLDGDMDILSISLAAQTVHWLENLDGCGTSWADHQIEECERGYWDFSAISAADFDMNGEMDIVLGTQMNVVVYYQLGSVFWGIQVCSEGWVYQLASNDADGDGDTDIYMISEHSWYGLFSFILNGYPSASWQLNEIEYIQSDFALGDIDGDGDLDMPTARYWAGGVKWYDYSAGYFIIEGTGAWSIATADFDIDGDMDVVVDYCSRLEWYENADGIGQEWIVRGFKNNPAALYYPDIAAGDFDFDGDADVTRRASGWLQIYWNEDYQGSEWSYLNSGISAIGTGDVCMADIDQDGIDDVVASWSTTGLLVWWKTGQRAHCGELTSAVLLLPSDPEWESIFWTCNQPPETSISFLVRSSDDPSDMGEWSDTIAVSGTSLAGVLSDCDNYLQYRVILSSSDVQATPELQEVIFNYNSLGIENDPVVVLSSGVVSNPVFGSAVIRFELSVQASVVIAVFDLSGRLVSRSLSSEYSVGSHDVLLGDFPPGIYFCTVAAGNLTTSQRFAVVEKGQSLGV